MQRPECVVCGRRGFGVRPWGITMPGGTSVQVQLYRQHAQPLLKITARRNSERRRVGVSGLDDLVDMDG